MQERRLPPISPLVLARREAQLVCGHVVLIGPARRELWRLFCPECGEFLEIAGVYDQGRAPRRE